MTDPKKSISRRMRYILSCLRDGEHPKEVAYRLRLGAGTIAFNTAEAQQILGARTTIHAVVLAISRGLISGRDREGSLINPEVEVPFDLDLLGKHQGFRRD